jgi:hypothetical protein
MVTFLDTVLTAWALAALATAVGMFVGWLTRAR